MLDHSRVGERPSSFAGNKRERCHNEILSAYCHNTLGVSGPGPQLVVVCTHFDAYIFNMVKRRRVSHEMASILQRRGSP